MELDKPREKPYISASQLNMYCSCSESYRRRYIEKEIIPPGVAMLRGTGVHKGAQHNFEQKVESHVDLPRKDIVDRAVAEVSDRSNAEGVYLTEDEESRGKDIVMGEAIDSTARLAGLFADEVAPVYQPTAVEQRQRIVLPDSPRDIIGILDLTATMAGKDGVGVCDWKTGKRTKPQRDFDTSVALSVYGLTFRALAGAPPAFMSIEQLVDLKTPKRVQMFTERTRSDFEALIARINTVLNGIEKGVFVPAPTGSWMCSPRFCGYARSCVYCNHAKMAAADAAGE